MNIKRKLSGLVLLTKQHSPEILLVTGLVSGGVCVYKACKATLKVNEVLDKSKETIDKIHSAEETVEEYSKEDAAKDLTVTYIQTGFNLAKLYAPAIIFGTLSVTSILASNNIMKKRVVGLAAAYTALDGTFKEYRGRVVDRFGEQIDKELRFNVKATEVEATTIDEDGNEVTTKEVVNVVGPSQYSQYARFFDELSKEFNKNSHLYNLTFLKQQEAWANEKLKAKGYLFLNEVYESLDIPETEEGHLVGWIYDEDNPIGDNFVDFGIYDACKEGSRDFVNGHEKAILLDFNVDGIISDKAWRVLRAK